MRKSRSFLLHWGCELHMVSGPSDQNSDSVSAQDLGSGFRRQDEELRESREFLEILWENAPDSIFLLNSRRIVVSFNSTAQKCFGYSTEEFAGMPFEQIVTSHLRGSQVLQCLQNTRGSSLWAGKELYGLRKDGSQFPVDVMVAPARSNQSEMFVAVVRDMSQQRALEEEHARALDALNAHDISLVSSTPDETLVEYTRFLSQLAAIAVVLYAAFSLFWLRFGNLLHSAFGMPFQDHIVPLFSLLLACVPLLVSNRSSRWFIFSALGAGGLIVAAAFLNTFDWFFANISAGGPSYAHHALRQSHFSAMGCLTFVLVGLSLAAAGASKFRLSQLLAGIVFSLGLLSITNYTYDIAARRILDPQLSLPLAMAVTVLAVSILFLHPTSGAVRIVVSPRMGGKLMRRLLPIVFVVPALGFLGKIGERTQIADLMTEMIAVLLPLSLWLVARTIDRLDLQRDAAMERAIVRSEELELLNRDLEKAKDEALQASHLKSTFIANISHELRTPLSGILGNIELLQSGSQLAKDQVEELNTAHDCAQSLLNIVNDLLDLSRIEAGKLSIEQAPFSPVDLMQESARTFASAIAAKGLKLELTADALVPRIVFGDPGRVRQVLLNLLNNAIKFTDAGIISMEALVEPGSNEDVCFISFAVRDSGIGIEAQDQSLLFQAFSQVDSSITRRFGGAGLGLSLCKNLVELMGGKIGMESVKGHGSTFWFSIPFSCSRKSSNAVPTATIAKLPAAAQNSVVLVVEDNLVVQRLVAKQLAALGLQCIFASTGNQAIEIYQNERCDLILMDFSLPDMSGLEVTRQIRRMGNISEGWHIPIIAMTANAMTGARELCLESGMDDYLSKPVSIRQLREKLSMWLPRERGLGSSALT